MIRGSCLCGGIRFRYARAVTEIGMCHCSQCRKVSGVASNANIVVPAADLEWLAGEELRQTYAKPCGWRTTFCRTCGSPVPQKLPAAEAQGAQRGDEASSGVPRSEPKASVGAYWVPAGLLDDDPGLRIAGHIYVGSKAPWDEIAGSAPQFEEGLPGRKR